MGDGTGADDTKFQHGSSFNQVFTGFIISCFTLKMDWASFELGRKRKGDPSDFGMKATEKVRRGQVTAFVIE